jgi:hypothetical protein
MATLHFELTAANSTQILSNIATFGHPTTIAEIQTNFGFIAIDNPITVTNFGDAITSMSGTDTLVLHYNKVLGDTSHSATQTARLNAFCQACTQVLAGKTITFHHSHIG